MRSKSLGEVLRSAVENADGPSGVPPPSSWDDPPRKPAWLYTLAMIGAGGFAAGTFCVFLSMIGSSPWLLIGGGAAIMLGAIVLAVAWAGLLGSGYGGVLAILGCLGPPAAIVYAAIHIHDGYSVVTTVVVAQVFGLGAFASGHLFAQGLHPGVRLSAGCTLLFVILAVWGASSDPRPPGWIQIIFDFAEFGGLTTTGLVLVGCLRSIARTSRDPL